jgi:hypothetical protein
VGFCHWASGQPAFPGRSGDNWCPGPIGQTDLQGEVDLVVGLGMTGLGSVSWRLA